MDKNTGSVLPEIITEITPEIRERFLAAKINHLRNNNKKDKPSPGNIASCLPDFSKIRKQSVVAEVKEDDLYKKDEKGMVWVDECELKKKLDQEELKRHGNDPYIRLAECGFPENRKDMNFILNHDFGVQLKNVVRELKSRKWAYAFGSVGRGKTALMIRAVWELLKDRPRSKASFISMSKFIREQFKRDAEIQNCLRRGESVDYDFGEHKLRGLVLLDDFDKINFDNEFNTRTILDLINRLKDMKAYVLITAQYSISDLFTRYSSNRDTEPLFDRIRGISYILPEFKGNSFRNK